MRVPLVYKDRPLFGFDLGTRSAKMIQLKPVGKSLKVLGYGYANFPDDAIVEGIIVDPKDVAAALRPLMKQMSYGRITATRVAASLPVGKVFTRVLELPPMNQADLSQAVRLEAEQYIPFPFPDLYLDYEVVAKDKDRNEVLMIAAPRAIVDSYIKLFELMGLEVGLIESAMSAAIRAISAATPMDKPTLVADIGSVSMDLTIYDKVIRMTDTTAIGGDSLIHQLVKDLGIDRNAAGDIVRKFGVGPSGLQPKVVASLGVPLAKMTAEIRRVMKYYHDRGDKKEKVQQIIIGGGAASMPGFDQYLSAQMSVPVHLASPWQGLEVKHLQKISKLDAAMYTTAIGLARTEGQL